jgi:4-hydroxy-3-polyprenylbenzoate decarboxylase
MASLIVAITGASGAIYGTRLLTALGRGGHEAYLIITETAKVVLREEAGWDLDCGAGEVPGRVRKLAGVPDARIAYFDNGDLGAAIASGSHQCDGMVVIPCTMGSLARIAAGTAETLLERAADVTLKERRPLVLVPREMPLNQIHLRNMLGLAQAGAQIVPAMPAFYHQPREIADLADFVVGKVLDQFRIDHDLYRRWRAEPEAAPDAQRPLPPPDA